MGTTQAARGNGVAVADAPEPKYWHLRTVLVRALDSEFQAGEVLPNERDLSARFGVARATLRQALDQLELEGRLVRRRGIGTLVAAPRMGVPVAETAGRDSWRIVDAGYAPAPAAVATTLGIPADEPVHAVRRLRMMHGQAIGAETLYVPDAVVPHVPAIFAKSSIADSSRARSVLRQLQRLELDGESRTVELGVAEEEQARMLERPPGTPVLVLTTRYQAQGGTAAVAVSTYRADMCRLTFGASGVVDVTPAAPAAEVRTAS
ncbi:MULTISPECIES: GntR family transcriptional regulator [Streptacidiphilus]|uniref:GntR family transcriptional regulator n=1 Tax=Streptacidiphilus cavernicola TaxID=3342716 RepID=A0ABV6UJY7_9ACTN|nr:GntR family transcriptional regulator [Streptacidiphilus jeojiense]